LTTRFRAKQRSSPGSV